MLFDEIQEAAGAIRATWKNTPSVGIILGTGLGGLVQDIQKEADFAYNEIPHFPRSTVQSHAGRLVCGKLAGKTVVAMEGRIHFYEGGSLQREMPVQRIAPGDAQHRAMCVVNEGEWHLFLNERQRQLLAVEFPRPLRIGSCNEADDAVIGEPELFRHRAMMNARAACRNTGLTP